MSYYCTYSFITLFTIGYGDISPLTVIAQKATITNWANGTVLHYNCNCCCSWKICFTNKLKKINNEKTLLLLALAITTIGFSQNLPKLFGKLSKSVAYIEVESYDYSTLLYDLSVHEEESLGSGVLVSEDGLVWTAAHVVQYAEKINVEFNDGDRYFAKGYCFKPQCRCSLTKT